MSLRDLLNERRWRHGDLAELDVEIVHRGAPGDRRVVPGWSITDVQAGGLLIDRVKAGEPLDPLADGALDPTSFIPWHRVLAVRRGAEVMWSKA